MPQPSCRGYLKTKHATKFQQSETCYLTRLRRDRPNYSSRNRMTLRRSEIVLKTAERRVYCELLEIESCGQTVAMFANDVWLFSKDRVKTVACGSSWFVDCRSGKVDVERWRERGIIPRSWFEGPCDLISVCISYLAGQTAGRCSLRSNIYYISTTTHQQFSFRCFISADINTVNVEHHSIDQSFSIE